MFMLNYFFFLDDKSPFKEPIKTKKNPYDDEESEDSEVEFLGSDVEFIGGKNGMLRHCFGGAVIVLSLQHFIAPASNLLPCLPSRGGREAIWAFYSRREHN